MAKQTCLQSLAAQTKKKPKSVLFPSLRKKNYKVDTGAPTDKKTSFQLAFCCLRKRSQEAQQGSKTSKWNEEIQQGLLALHLFPSAIMGPVFVSTWQWLVWKSHPREDCKQEALAAQKPKSLSSRKSVKAVLERMNCDQSSGFPPSPHHQTGKEGLGGMEGAERKSTHFNHSLTRPRRSRWKRPQ